MQMWKYGRDTANKNNERSLKRCVSNSDFESSTAAISMNISYFCLFWFSRSEQMSEQNLNWGIKE